MKVTVSAVFGLLIAVSLGGRSQVVGALSWAVVTFGLDFYWQWFRWYRVQLVSPSMALKCVSGGFLLRVLSIVLAVWLARYWFHPRVFNIYIFTLLTLPLWNIIAVFYFAKGK